MTGFLWDLLTPIVDAIRSKPPAPRPPTPVRAKSKHPTASTKSPAPIIAPPLFPPPHSLLVDPGRCPAPALQSTSRGPRRLSKSPAEPMQEKYDAVVRLMLETYNIRVRKWRSNMSGIAWYVTYRDGRVQRLIEAPRPKGPMSVAVFLHEIGHHAIGFDVYKPRCLEEYHAWRWAIEAMEAQGLNITDQVRSRMYRSLWYAVHKAKRRGIKQIPAELTPYLEKPVFKRRARTKGRV